jgi:hypothetical protein
MMDIQRLRNLTTGRLHTEMGHIYEDLGMLTGEQGLMTHMLPRAMKAVEPWLREQVKDERFWDGKYDVTHTGEYDLPIPTKEDQQTFFERFAEMPNPLAGKEVIGVVV